MSHALVQGVFDSQPNKPGFCPHIVYGPSVIHLICVINGYGIQKVCEMVLTPTSNEQSC